MKKKKLKCQICVEEVDCHPKIQTLTYQRRLVWLKVELFNQKTSLGQGSICFKVNRTYSSTVNLFKLIKDRVFSRKTTTTIINNQSSPGASDEKSFVLNSLYGLDQIQCSNQKKSITSRKTQFYKTINDELISIATQNILTEKLITKKYLQVIERISAII
jgi:hypothetical protein